MDRQSSEIDGANGLAARPAPLAPNLILWAILIVLLGAALLGLLGGGSYATDAAAARKASLEIIAPGVLRTGEYFEIRADIAARQPVAKPTLAIGAGLWRNVTVNSFYPAAKSETSEADQFRFEYDALKAGDSLLVKIDGQVNDNMTDRLSGPIRLLDGQEEIARIDMTIKVLP